MALSALRDSIQTLFHRQLSFTQLLNAMHPVPTSVLFNWGSAEPKALSTPLQKSATVVENSDCHRKVRLSQKTARQCGQSPNSATVALFCETLRKFLQETFCILMQVHTSLCTNCCRTVILETALDISE